MRKSPMRLAALALRTSSPRRGATQAYWMVWLTGSGIRQALNMNDTPETSSAPPVAASVATPQPRMHALLFVVLLVFVLVLVVVGWLWFVCCVCFCVLLFVLGRRLAESGKDVRESRLLVCFV